jgi:hypothetical protein
VCIYAQSETVINNVGLVQSGQHSHHIQLNLFSPWYSCKHCSSVGKQHSLTHSFTHSLTHSLTPIFEICVRENIMKVVPSVVFYLIIIVINYCSRTVFSYYIMTMPNKEDASSYLSSSDALPLCMLSVVSCHQYL